jgi:hypothetical protein
VRIKRHIQRFNNGRTKCKYDTARAAPWLSGGLRTSVAALALGLLLQSPPASISEQSLGSVDPEETLDWVPGAIKHAQDMRKYQDADAGTQPTPGIIPAFELDDDPSGQIAAYQPANHRSIVGQLTP